MSPPLARARMQRVQGRRQQAPEEAEALYRSKPRPRTITRTAALQGTDGLQCRRELTSTGVVAKPLALPSKHGKGSPLPHAPN